ncbi:MAG TPA: LON peptidase substrate-binding domain-containing protein [Burkholderiales bacterium]|jgi:Lon protease-like protein|nr:LON peptidase substrate-binding domain-containing protein [Burkholderiales bacterium]
MTEEHFIFPLGTVLFPGGTLPLKIFEQRYLEMTKICIRDSRPFGVCLIKEGSEVGTPAVPETIGCLASIERWDMPQLGVFELVARGGQRFRLLESRVAANGLISASIERIADDTPSTHVDAACREVLKLIINRVGATHFPEPIALDDATWVGCRLAEVLPLDAHVKQSLLEVPDAAGRLDRLREILVKEGLVVND